MRLTRFDKTGCIFDSLTICQLVFKARVGLRRRHLSETVCIAWGRNEPVARAVAKHLSNSGYSPIVGGANRGGNPSSFFINSNVLAQMDDASAAIILAQPIYADKNKPTPDLRPNLLFEWGYLQKHLRADAIHAFLINLQPTDLPSDLLNS
jgi:hypothetical protein